MVIALAALPASLRLRRPLCPDLPRTAHDAVAISAKDSAAATIGLPVAWNLAGGYQRDALGGIEPVLAIHRATMRACAAAFAAQDRVEQP